MVASSCRVCGAVVKNDTICAMHKQQYTARQSAYRELTRPTRNNRGYDKSYYRNRQVVINSVVFGYTLCVLCAKSIDSKSDLSVEHIIAIRNGGTSDIANLAPAHRRCNYGWRAP